MSEQVEKSPHALVGDPIHIEEEVEETSWTEEVVVAGGELVGAVQRLVNETSVRRLVIRNEARRIHLQVPLLLGVAGIALAPAYAALALIAALVTDCTILVERAAPRNLPETSVTE